jgi:hypothetical protein
MDRVRPIRDSRGRSRPNPFRMCRYKTPIFKSFSFCRYETPSYLHILRDLKSFGICRYATTPANSFRMCRYVNGGRARYCAVKAKSVAPLSPLPVPLSAPPPCAPRLRALRADSYPISTSHESPACPPKPWRRRVTIHRPVYSTTYTLNFAQLLYSQAITHSGGRGVPPFLTPSIS